MGLTTDVTWSRANARIFNFPPLRDQAPEEHFAFLRRLRAADSEAELPQADRELLERTRANIAKA